MCYLYEIYNALKELGKDMYKFGHDLDEKLLQICSSFNLIVVSKEYT